MLVALALTFLLSALSIATGLYAYKKNNIILATLILSFWAGILSVPVTQWFLGVA